VTKKLNAKKSTQVFIILADGLYSLGAMDHALKAFEDLYAAIGGSNQVVTAKYVNLLAEIDPEKAFKVSQTLGSQQMDMGSEDI
jgi:hypothetical protein